MNEYKPMMAQSRRKAFDDPQWLFEVKWDGIRALAYIGKDLSIRSRNQKELLTKFPELKELTQLTSNVVLDGEIIIMKDGRVDFQTVAKRNQASDKKDIEFMQTKHPATYVVFDILEMDNESLLDLPLIERKKILKTRLQEGKHVVHSSTIDEHGINYYQAVIQKNLEGIIAKRKQSTYKPGARSNDWLKIKRIKTLDAIIFGYTPGAGSRTNSFGSLLLGLYDEEIPVYIGKVGTGFTDNDLLQIKAKLDNLPNKTRWFTEPDIPPDSTWVKPKLVATIGYQQLTDDSRLRSPTFQKLRNDKPPEFCTLSQLRPQLLEEYYTKRDFSKTPEPEGGISRGMENSFVIQEHHARSLHWDFRLERDGVLVSWAVPKGVPDTPGVRRLAIQTEDHPLEYGGFEGIIPKGQYGAGEVEIWDKGFYVPVKWTKDKIEVVLAGNRIQGKYELIKFGDPEKKNWLLFRKRA
jgi:DNA ligase D-like protein (predicted ligase)/DNA ligase D-like protein (predicted 3'-phosphoesterase)